MLPELRFVSEALGSQLFANVLKGLSAVLPERLRLVPRPKKKDPVTNIIGKLFDDPLGSLDDAAIKVNEQHHISVLMLSKGRDLFFDKTIEHVTPSACRRQHLYVSRFQIRIQHKAVGYLAIGIVFGQDDYMRLVEIDAQGSNSPSSKDCTTSEPEVSSPNRRCWVGSRWLLRPSTQVFSLENLRMASSLCVVMRI